LAKKTVLGTVHHKFIRLYAFLIEAGAQETLGHGAAGQFIAPERFGSKDLCIGFSRLHAARPTW
jgi:hypothetical protein